MYGPWIEIYVPAKNPFQKPTVSSPYPRRIFGPLPYACQSINQSISSHHSPHTDSSRYSIEIRMLDTYGAITQHHHSPTASNKVTIITDSRTTRISPPDPARLSSHPGSSDPIPSPSVPYVAKVPTSLTRLVTLSSQALPPPTLPHNYSNFPSPFFGFHFNRATLSKSQHM